MLGRRREPWGNDRYEPPRPVLPSGPKVDGLAGLEPTLADLHDRTAAYARNLVATAGPLWPFAVAVDLTGHGDVVEVPRDVAIAPDLHLVATLVERRDGLAAVCLVDDVQRQDDTALRFRLEDREGRTATVWHGHEAELDGTVTWVAMTREPGVRLVWA